MVFAEIDGLPLAVEDAVANLPGRFAAPRFFVGIESFLDAGFTARTVTADEAVEQAAMPLAAVAMAVARLLVQNFFHAPGGEVSVRNDFVGIKRWIHSGRKRPARRLRVECGDRLGVCLLRPGGRELRKHQ